MSSFSFLIALAPLLLPSVPAQIATMRFTVTDLNGFGADGPAIAWAINSRGDLAGQKSAPSGGITAFLFRDTALIPLQLAPAAAPDSTAYGVNDAGTVVGVVAGGGATHGYLYNAGAVNDLHAAISLGGSSSFVAAIDAAGNIVGASGASGVDLSSRHAFLYKAARLTDLHPVVSFGGVWSEALGINTPGDIVGASQTADLSCFHAFLLRAGTRAAIDLHPALQHGGCSSRANSINSKGEIVGAAISRTGDSRAFLYSAGTAADLNGLIPPDSGWVLKSATGINDSRQIVGFGQYLGQARAFLLAPSGGAPDPPPAAAPLSISQLLTSQDQYVGQKLQVTGILRIVPQYSLLPCPGNVQPCNPILSVTVFLQDPNDSTKQLLIYQGGNPYKCSFDIQGNYKCPPFTDNASVTLDGVYSKGKQPAGTVGSASPAGGGTPPQVITYKDFYYFDVIPATNPQRPARRKAR